MLLFLNQVKRLRFLGNLILQITHDVFVHYFGFQLWWTILAPWRSFCINTSQWVLVSPRNAWYILVVLELWFENLLGIKYSRDTTLLLEFPILRTTPFRHLIVKNLFDFVLILPWNWLGEESAVITTNLISIIIYVPVSEKVICHRIIDIVHLVTGDHVVLVSHSNHLVNVFLLSHIAWFSSIYNKLLPYLLLPTITLWIRGMKPLMMRVYLIEVFV